MFDGSLCHLWFIGGELEASLRSTAASSFCVQGGCGVSAVKSSLTRNRHKKMVPRKIHSHANRFHFDERIRKEIKHRGKRNLSDDGKVGSTLLCRHERNSTPKGETSQQEQADRAVNDTDT